MKSGFSDYRSSLVSFTLLLTPSFHAVVDQYLQNVAVFILCKITSCSFFNVSVTTPLQAEQSLLKTVPDPANDNSVSGSTVPRDQPLKAVRETIIFRVLG